MRSAPYGPRRNVPPTRAQCTYPERSKVREAKGQGAPTTHLLELVNRQPERLQLQRRPRGPVPHEEQSVDLRMPAVLRRVGLRQRAPRGQRIGCRGLARGPCIKATRPMRHHAIMIKAQCDESAKLKPLCCVHRRRVAFLRPHSAPPRHPWPPWPLHPADLPPQASAPRAGGRFKFEMRVRGHLFLQ